MIRKAVIPTSQIAGIPEVSVAMLESKPSSAGATSDLLIFMDEIAQRISRPLTKTSSLVAVYTIAYGNNHIQIIDISLIPFSFGSSYPSFLDN